MICQKNLRKRKLDQLYLKVRVKSKVRSEVDERMEEDYKNELEENITQQKKI